MSRKRFVFETPVRGSPPYMFTFADMVTSILTFFALLVSMATFEPAKFKVATESLQGAFGVLESFPTVPINPFVRIPRQDGGESRRKASINDAKKLQKILQSNNGGVEVQVEVTETGIGILLRDPASFTSGSADLGPSSQSILNDIATVIKSNPGLKIRVEGHTDDVPIHTAQYRSNWELSSARALSVVELLASRTGINPANMSAVGYGEFKPLQANTDEQSRAKNRRIQIFVDYLEPTQGK